MTSEEYVKEIIKMLKKIKTKSLLKMIYTVTKTCLEKETRE